MRAIYDSVDKGTAACNINNAFLKGERGIVLHTVLHSAAPLNMIYSTFHDPYASPKALIVTL